MIKNKRTFKIRTFTYFHLPLQKQKERACSQFLIHFPNAHRQTGLGQAEGRSPKTQSRSPRRMVGNQLFESSPSASQGVHLQEVEPGFTPRQKENTAVPSDDVFPMPNIPCRKKHENGLLGLQIQIQLNCDTKGHILRVQLKVQLKVQQGEDTKLRRKDLYFAHFFLPWMKSLIWH